MRNDLIKYDNGVLTISSNAGIYVCASLGMILTYKIAKFIIDKDYKKLTFNFKNQMIEASK